MGTWNKLLAGFVGHLKPNRAQGRSVAQTLLPPPQFRSAMTLEQALHERRSGRDFQSTALPLEVISTLLWSAFGVNRAQGGGRTAPSALNAQEIDIYLVTAEAVHLYEAQRHVLHRVAEVDARRVTGYQDFVDDAPLDLVYVADFSHLHAIPREQRLVYAGASAGAIAQNVYLYCASAGMSTVVRGWFDRQSLERALELGSDEQPLLCQTVGYPLPADG